MMPSLSPKKVTSREFKVPSREFKVKTRLFNFELATWDLRLTTRHLNLLLLALGRARLFVRDPRDEEAEPVVRGLKDLYSDASRSVDRGRGAHDARRRLYGRAVGAVRA